MPQEPRRVESIVLACCCLHNLMRNKYPALQNGILDQEDPVTHEVQPGAWRDQQPLEQLPHLRGRNASKEAKELRTYLVDYVNSPVGSVPWQKDRI